MKFYFAASIRGGRIDQSIYAKIVEVLESHGEILDKHVASSHVNNLEKNNSLEFIYNRDVKMINDCNILVAEVTVPSLGVGYEICYAENIGKRIICMYNEEVNISAMIGGNKNIEIIKYKCIDDMASKLTLKLK